VKIFQETTSCSSKLRCKAWEVFRDYIKYDCMKQDSLLNSLQILNQIDLYIYENRIEDLRTLFQNYRVKFILISWKAYVEVPEILHFKTLTKPEVFYNITGNIIRTSLPIFEHLNVHCEMK
jgi:hypothetical protein